LGDSGAQRHFARSHILIAPEPLLNLKWRKIIGAPGSRKPVAPAADNEVPEVPCYLLQAGLRVAVRPRCAGCEQEIDLPREKGDRFRLALEFLRDNQSAPRNGLVRRLFIGEKALIANASVRLNQQFSAPVTQIGARVLVVNPVLEPNQPQMVLFCEGCGLNVMARVESEMASHYRWDRLVQFESREVSRRRSRSGIATFALSLVRADGASPSHPPSRDTAMRRLNDFDVARAYFFARDALFAGPQRLRDLHLAAMRRRTPISLAEQALCELGATFARDSAGESIVIPPTSFAAGEFVLANQPPAPLSDRALAHQPMFGGPLAGSTA
jgi:hypothetical protein